jgi:hypothetical protein
MGCHYKGETRDEAKIDAPTPTAPIASRSRRNWPLSVLRSCEDIAIAEPYLSWMLHQSSGSSC